MKYSQLHIQSVEVNKDQNLKTNNDKVYKQSDINKGNTSFVNLRDRLISEYSSVLTDDLPENSI